MDKFKQLSDKLWEYAEPGMREYKSARAYAEFLKNEGFTVNEKICGMDTAFEGVFGSGSPVICFLAEYDALSGLNQRANIFNQEKDSDSDTGQGCGHHLLGVGSLYGACLYKEYLEKNGLSGTVKFVGCPGEEAGSGKTYLARDGYFDDCDIALTWHPGIFNQVVTGSSQSCTAIYFKFKGIASHAASAPHLGRSALDAAELMNVGVNYLREHMEDSDRVHYAYIDAGGKAPNVVQNLTILKYFVRSKNNHDCSSLTERVINCAKGAALMTGTEVEVIFDEGLSNTISNQTLENVLFETMKEDYDLSYGLDECEYLSKYKSSFDGKINIPLMVKDENKLKEDIKNNVICSYIIEKEHHDICQMGSTDVGDVSWCVPTGQFNTACFAYGASGHSWQWVAQGKSSVADKGMKYAGRVLCDAAIKLHNNPELIEKAKRELKLKLDGESYKCPIPKDVKPHVYDF
ncbi:MAG: amidohydrolase [Solobacterium sp.]|nr:amidohydrolase [Solobacterium sp.]